MLLLLIVLVAIAIASPLTIALFRKAEYEVSRKVVIERSASNIYNYIRFIDNMEHYNKWVMKDPAATRVVKTGIDGTTGYQYAWDSNKSSVGKGVQEITGLVENERMETEIRFEKPFKGTSFSKLILTSLSDNKTRMEWSFYSSDMPYSARLMHTVLNLQKMLGKDLQESLNNLKVILEK